MIRQGAVTVDGEAVSSEEATVILDPAGARVVRVGRRRFARILAG